MRIVGYQREPLCLRLGDQHSVEGVTMVQGQIGCYLGMLKSYREIGIPLPGN